MEGATTILDDAEPGDGVGLSVLVLSPQNLQTLPLPATGHVVIGRGRESNIRIEHGKVSRRHARLHLEPQLAVEDLGSSNGTRVRDKRLEPKETMPIALGEAVTLGPADAPVVLIVQRMRGGRHQSKLWTHASFADQLAAECEKAEAAGGVFAVVRIKLCRPVSWMRVVPLLAAEIEPPHVFGAYGPDDYELLLCERSTERVQAIVTALDTSLHGINATPRTSVSWYPRDGKTYDALIEHANARLNPHPVAEVHAGEYRSEEMARAYELAQRFAKSTISVLILGETGVGKEVMARSIHSLSPRADMPLVALNCAGLSETLIESELFGHERGAFTGATAAKKGLLEAADGGTVFLDEIGDMPLNVQAKLLRVIETREVLPVGALKPRRIDVRFVSATNRDLENRQGSFREDLFFRLNGVTLRIPPLRQRKAEIPELAELFLQQVGHASDSLPRRLSREALDLLMEHDWPGNIRELKNVMERAVVLCDGDTLESQHFPDTLPRKTIWLPELDTDSGAQSTRRPISPDALDERARIVDALAACGGNQTAAAEMLSIPRRTFCNRLKEYGITRPVADRARGGR